MILNGTIVLKRAYARYYFNSSHNQNYCEVSLKRSVLLFIFILHLLSAKEINRSGYGNSMPGVWSNLTAFEKASMAKIEQAANGEGRALLALSLIGSGDIRTEQQFLSIEREVNSFIKTVKKKMPTSMKKEEQAALILTEMHNHFFIKSPTGNTLRGYSFNQSKLSDIFAQKRYNCVSSSLLYLILLSYFDIPAQGVLVPSHVFVQIKIGKKTFEVETTSQSGFDFEHTKESFEDKSRGWYERRGLEYYGWEEYLNRRVVSPLETVLHNYNNQHTGEDRMQFADRLRLAEISHLLSPNTKKLQSQRISYYLNESNHIRQSNNRETIQSFRKTVKPFLDSMLQKPLNDTIYSYIYAIELSSIIAQIPYRSAEITEAQLFSFLGRIPQHIALQNVIGQNSLYIVAQVIKEYREQGKAERSKDLLERLRNNYPQLAEALSEFSVLQYNLELHALIDLLSIEQYEKCLTGFEKYLTTLPDSLQTNRRVKHNTLYLISRLVQVYQKRNDGDKLLSMLNLVKEEFPNLKKDIAEYYSFVHSFRLRALINEAKDGTPENTLPMFLNFLSSLPQKEREDHVIETNSLYLFTLLLLQRQELHNSQFETLENALLKTFPQNEKRIKTIYQSHFRNDLLHLINRANEGDYNELHQEYLSFLEGLPTKQLSDTVLIHNGGYLFHALEKQWGTQAQEILKPLSAKLLQLYPNEKERFSISKGSGYDQQMASMVELLKAGKKSDFTREASLLVTSFPDSLLSDNILKNNMTYIISQAVEVYNNSNHSNAKKSLLYTVEKHLPTLFPTFEPMLSHTLFEEGNQLFQKRLWEQAINSYQSALVYTTDKRARKALLSNIDIAYHNWAVNVAKNGDREKARIIIEGALILYPDATKCKEFLTRM